MHVRSILPSGVSIRLKPFFFGEINNIFKLKMVKFDSFGHLVHLKIFKNKNQTYILMIFLDICRKEFTLECVQKTAVYRTMCLLQVARIYMACVFGAISCVKFVNRLWC